MAVAGERLGIGISRHFTTESRHPYDEVVWERGTSRISDYRTGAVAFEQPGVEVPSTWSLNATNILAQKYFRGTVGLAGAGDLAPTGRRPGRGHDHDLGDRRTATSSTRRSGHIQRRAQAPDRAAKGGVQLAGLVQHRRLRRASASCGVLHPRRRGLDGLDPQLVRRRRASSSREDLEQESTSPISARRESFSTVAERRRGR